MCAKRTMALKGLKGRLRELAKKADCYEELKLNLMLEGWNLDDDEKVRAAVKKWLYSSSGVDNSMGMLKNIIAIWETVDASRTVARCEVLKGLWKDVVGLKDEKAARVGLLLAANVLDSSWRDIDAADTVGVNALAELVAWFGKMAY